ncbi:MAG: DUF3592 domain-containing protein [Akkermansiaceae bacterium]
MFLLGGMLAASQWIFAFGDLFRMQGWEEADGLVTSSEFATSSSSESSNSGKVLIRYDYGFRGQRYSGDRYDIGSTNTNMGVKRMKEVIRAHPPGTPLIVWVNPKEPGDAIITRKLAPQIWIMIPFSTPFLLVGILGTGYGLSGGWFYRRSQKLKSELAPNAPPKISKTLEQEFQNPNQKLLFTAMEGSYTGIALLAVSVFWNGIVTVFLIAMTQKLMNGEKQGAYLALFLIPFVIVGGVLVVMTYRSFLGPKPPSWLILAEGVLPGNSDGQVELTWIPLRETHPQDFRSCTCKVERWKQRMTLSKWMKINPGWSKDLVTMKKDTAGELEVSFPKLPGKGSFFESEFDLHLIMAWTARDGRKHSDSWQLSPSRDSD